MPKGLFIQTDRHTCTHLYIFWAMKHSGGEKNSKLQKYIYLIKELY